MTPFQSFVSFLRTIETSSPNLTALDLSYADLGERGAQALAGAIKVSPTPPRPPALSHILWSEEE